jgi:DNA invertase Pin-like site-specific DNA recombinase
MWYGAGLSTEAAMTKRAALYLRVSTDQQTTENQRIELERVAQARGWEVVAVYEDAGISGAKGRDKRPGFDLMLKDMHRCKFDVIMAWAVDRLGRSLQDLVAFLSDLQASDKNLYLHQQALDTTTPSGEAMFGMLSVFAQFERRMIQARVNAGLARARAKGVRLGRAPTSPKVEAQIKELLAGGMGKLKIARQLGIGTSVVQRVAAARQ